MMHGDNGNTKINLMQFVVKKTDIKLLADFFRFQKPWTKQLYLLQISGCTLQFMQACDDGINKKQRNLR
jgi:hypothetical protein